MSARELGEGRRKGDHDEDDEARHEDETGVHCPQDGRPAKDLPAVEAGCAVHSRPFDLCKLWNSSALSPQIARRAFPFDSTIL